MISNERLKEIANSVPASLPIEMVAIAHELLERREADRWIPVSEQLPESNCCVLTWDEEAQSVGFFKGDGLWSSDRDNIFYVDNITAWRPLPVPPGPRASPREMCDPVCDEHYCPWREAREILGKRVSE